jgi:uncharacterized protein (TIGR03086 family)
VSEVSDRYGRVVGRFTVLVEGCPPERWSASSPCEGWTARDVAAHAVDVQRRVATGVDGSTAAPLGPEEDVASAWRAATAAVQAALDDPTSAGATVTGPFGEQPFEQLVGRLGCADALIHTWDFARATRQDERLDAEAVEAAGAFLRPIGDRLRGGGAFAPALPPLDGADAQTALLCFLGRRP